MARIALHFNVVDCEHQGDLQSAWNEVINAGGTPHKTYWDGEDCGEAYIVFSCEENKVNAVVEQLGEGLVW